VCLSKNETHVQDETEKGQWRLQWLLLLLEQRGNKDLFFGFFVVDMSLFVHGYCLQEDRYLFMDLVHEGPLILIGRRCRCRCRFCRCVAWLVLNFPFIFFGSVVVAFFDVVSSKYLCVLLFEIDSN
jgi:hypothetical protein